MFMGKGEVQQEVQDAFHLFEMTQVVERRQRKIGVSQPAITIIPVAWSTHLLRQAGRHCRQNRSRVLETVKLQGQRGPDDLLLVQQRHRAVLDPCPPVPCGLLKKVVRHLDEVVFYAKSPCRPK